MNKLIKILDILRSYPVHLYFFLRNKNKSFTIVSNDCWGAEAYNVTNLPYLTPFVGLMIMAPCYIKLLKNLQIIKSQKLKFINQSKYNLVSLRKYPIGLINDIEIHFLHYQSEEEVLNKWERRIKRMDWNNLFIKFDGSKDFASDEHLRIFNDLPYKNKICFVKTKIGNFSSVIQISEWDVDGKKMFRLCQKEFDVIGWLNNRKRNSSKIMRIFFPIFIRPL